MSDSKDTPSTDTSITADDLAVGELQLYDYYEPALKAGSYVIKVKQTLKDVNTDELVAEQEFLVAAPQYSLSPEQIINQHPPAGSVGLYSEVLPHIVLKDPMLAWERPMNDRNNQPIKGTPWLALLVFEETELTAIKETELTANTDPALKYDAATRTFTSTVAALQALPDVLKTLTPPEKELVEEDKSPVCQYIRMKATTFQAVVPRLNELPYLSHVRKINTGERPLLGLNEHGLFSVTMANRFAHAADNADALPTTNIVHLVSLEGLEKHLTDAGVVDDKKDKDDVIIPYLEVALITLASWTFRVKPDHAEDFKGLGLKLIEQEACKGKSLGPAQSWLRLPPTLDPAPKAADLAPKAPKAADLAPKAPKAADSAPKAAIEEATRRLGQGYVPLPYHTRSGESTLAWYRGPLAPLLTVSATPDTPYYTSDAALLYNDAFGVFDVSLAAAWEVGREAALADSAFGPRLLDFRRRAHQLVDGLHHRVTSDHFTCTQIDKVDVSATVQDMFLARLVPQLRYDLGTGVEDELSTPAVAPAPPVAPAKTAARLDARAILAEESVQAQVKALVKTDLAPLAEWLGRLLLLYPVPFDNLVPDERMLPPESLRFFYLDENWLKAALDGALSLGLDSSKQTAFSQATKGLMHEAGMEALAVMRNQLQGRPASADVQPPKVVSGFLLRSALVSGWPNLVVRAKDKDKDTTLKILRLDHLAPNVLLCLFDGVPDNVELSEPAEGLGFGVNDGGEAALRFVEVTGPYRVGEQLKANQKEQVVKTRYMAEKPVDDTNQDIAYGMRASNSRVLNINPDDPEGLVQLLTAGLRTHGAVLPPHGLGPAAFSLQLIRAAEAVVFTNQPKDGAAIHSSPSPA